MFERLAKKNSQIRLTVQVISAADGITRLSGHAAAIQSLINAASPNGLLRRGGAQASESVTVTEQGTTGFYDIAFTPTVGSDNGEPYFLSYREPSGIGAMGSITEFSIQVFDSISVTPLGGSYYTSLANVKEYRGVAGAGDDAVLASLIARCSSEIQGHLRRVGFQATYTETKDGSGGASILLVERPIVSVTSLYDSVDGTFDSTTLVDQADYAIDKVAGIIRKRWVPFLYSDQGVRVVYVGGWATVPLDVEQVCIELVLMKLEARNNLTTSQVSHGDGSRTFQREPSLTPAMKERLARYVNAEAY